MTTRYFVYKTNYITNVGGITPPQPETGHLGLGYYNGWYLGQIDESELDWFQKAREFNINPCTPQVAQGFPLLNLAADVTTIEETDEVTMETIVRPLTSAELECKAEATSFIAKLSLRPRIVSSVGDQDDQMSDLAKRTALIERCLFAIFDSLPVEVISKMTTDYPEWAALMTKTSSDFKTGALVDPIDVRPDGYDNIYEILKLRSNALTAALAEYYALSMTPRT